VIKTDADRKETGKFFVYHQLPSLVYPSAKTLNTGAKRLSWRVAGQTLVGGCSGWGAGIAGFCVAKRAFADLFRQLEACLSICAIQGK